MDEQLSTFGHTPRPLKQPVVHARSREIMATF
jgi:hypothetical protein